MPQWPPVLLIERTLEKFTLRRWHDVIFTEELQAKPERLPSIVLTLKSFQPLTQFSNIYIFWEYYTQILASETEAMSDNIQILEDANTPDDVSN